MSWFGKDASSLLDSGADFHATDESMDLEIEDGVVVERRSVLWLSATAVASVLAGGAAVPGRAIGQDKQKPAAKDGDAGVSEGDGTFAAFLAWAYPRAQKFVASGGKGEESYLLSLAAAMASLKDPGGEIRKEMRAFSQRHRKEGERFPIMAMQMRLRPGGGFSHHDHRNYNGVILGIEGEVRIRNFDVLGDNPVPPKGKTFQIRETRDDLILPGRFSSLASRRENVHELVAGKEGGRVLDVFTFLGKGARSVYMKVAAQPRDAERRIWDASWK